VSALVPPRPILELDRLEASYRHLRVLRGVSLLVQEAEFVALLGANGAGKTTTLRAICGMIPSTGRLRFMGQTLAGKASEDVVRLGIAHVPQGRGTFPNLTVYENLLVGAATRRDRDIARDAMEWLETFPQLAARRNVAAGSLSGGEQQMLAISRAMMSRPKLLLLDEPSLGLAPNITAELFDRLADLNVSRGLAMLVVEQNANLALNRTHRAYVLEGGETVLDGGSDDLARDDRVRQAYLRA
jgi:branched-chain amino acid transport system ATP-binding protein